MKIDLVKPALVAGMIFFAVMWLTKSCDKPETQPSDNVEWRTRVTELQAQIVRNDSTIAELEAARATQIKQHTSDSARQAVQIARLSHGYSKAKQQVQELSDSTGRINAYVQASDSLLEAKDSLYRQEVGHRIALELSYKMEVATLGEKYVNQVEVSNEYEARVAQLGKENQLLGKKLERKKRGNRILLGVSAGLLTAVGVMSLTQ